MWSPSRRVHKRARRSLDPFYCCCSSSNADNVKEEAIVVEWLKVAPHHQAQQYPFRYCCDVVIVNTNIAVGFEISIWNLMKRGEDNKGLPTRLHSYCYCIPFLLPPLHTVPTRLAGYLWCCCLRCLSAPPDFSPPACPPSHPLLPFS